MKIHPILFSTPMVQAILEGRKTQTRRIITKQNSDYDLPFLELNFNDSILYGDGYMKVKHKVEDTRHRVFAKIEADDVLWVRETSACIGFDINGEDIEGGVWIYKADGQKAQEHLDMTEVPTWRPSIYMPKEACRIFLKVKSVRPERLQDINGYDCTQEGILVGDGNGCYNYETKKYDLKTDTIKSFQTLWQSINGKESWQQNPYVWVYEFERTTKPTNF